MSRLDLITGNPGDQRLQQPPKGEGDVAGQRHGFALHVNTAVFLLKSPVGVESPEIASALTNGPFFAVWTVWVKSKHCVRSLTAGLPSRGGNGAPFASLFAVGVLVSNS